MIACITHKEPVICRVHNNPQAGSAHSQLIRSVVGSQFCIDRYGCGQTCFVVLPEQIVCIGVIGKAGREAIHHHTVVAVFRNEETVIHIVIHHSCRHVECRLRCSLVAARMQRLPENIRGLFPVSDACNIVYFDAVALCLHHEQTFAGGIVGKPLRGSHTLT